MSGGGAPADVRQFVGRLNKSGSRKLVLATTGAGATAFAWLTSEPGASATLLEGVFPYNQAALNRLIAPSYLEEGKGAVSVETSVAMAEACSLRGKSLARDASLPMESVLGIGATAAIATARERRGENKFFVSVATDSCVHTYGAVLEKGARQRLEEEQLVSRMIMSAIERTVGEEDQGAAAAGRRVVNVPLADAEVLQYYRRERSVEALIAQLQEGKIQCVVCDELGLTGSATRQFRGVVLPGSFNPLHRGHRRMLDAARMVSGAQHGAFELAIVNADKPTIPADEVMKRVRQFQGVAPVILTSEPLFTAKAQLLPGCDFAIGYDTAVRILTPSYYGGRAEMIKDLSLLLGQGTTMYVAGRRSFDSDKFLTLHDIDVPEELSELFEKIPEALFREDISSTEIRRRLDDGS